MRSPALRPLVLSCLLASFPGLAAAGAAPAGVHFAPFGPGNGEIALAADPASGTLYAGFQVGGLFRSVDGGRSWAWSGRGLGKQGIKAVAVGAAGEVYAAIEVRGRLEIVADPARPELFYAEILAGGALRQVRDGSVPP
jgi:hypothetical protein